LSLDIFAEGEGTAERDDSAAGRDGSAARRDDSAFGSETVGRARTKEDVKKDTWPWTRPLVMVPLKAFIDLLWMGILLPILP